MTNPNRSNPTTSPEGVIILAFYLVIVLYCLIS